ncbi:MAG: metallophosphoesterase family protein [Acidobacteria bacterium]|nr:metallophosphoesterase family protein [Acidobacteriota bacterium]
MRVQVISDLHLEFDPAIPPLAPDAEAVIIAGDLAPHAPGLLARVRDAWQDARQVLYVPGNHEYYGHDLDEAAEALAADCASAGLTLLNPGTAELGGARVIGATLWTNFALDGDPGVAMMIAARQINDFSGAIRTDGGEAVFTAAASASRHSRERAFIEDALFAAPGPTVVVTHHAPTPRSIHPRYRTSALNGAFVSDLETVIARHQPALWIHGHVHDPVDTVLGKTRVLANPRGYPDEGRRNGFDSRLTITVPPPTTAAGRD